MQGPLPDGGTKFRNACNAHGIWLHKRMVVRAKNQTWDAARIEPLQQPAGDCPKLATDAIDLNVEKTTARGRR
eukprot:2315427-Lingulodinium_polyedra.AAC.1